MLPMKSICLMLMACAGPLAAQRQVLPPALRIADSSAGKIVAAFRTSPSKTAAILRQVEGQQPSAKLKEITDSLVAIATQSNVVGDPLGPSAIGTLRDAARRETSEFRGVPVNGVFDRFVEIYQRAASGTVRLTVLQDMLVVDHARALPYLEQVAVSTDPMARWAMTSLGNEINPETFIYKEALPADRNATAAFLHQLWVKVSKEQPNSNSAVRYQSVPNEQAFNALWIIARQQGWIK